MKRIMCHLIVLILSAALCPGLPAGAEGIGQASAADGNALPKVILDTDIAYVNDDAIAMFMLAQADSCGMLKLLGVTTAGGNVFIPEATTAALRQLELIGRADIPVYQGTDEPLQGYRDMKEESRLYGIPYYCGAYWDFSTNDFTDLSRRSPDYLHLLEAPMHGYAETPAQEEAAWDFIIRAVHEYPGEVTIMAVGAATNIALALQKDPTLADDAAGIIYMGGDIDCPGDATPGINSGRAVSWPQHWLNNMETGEGFPEGVNKATIVFSIDGEAFWDFYVELLSKE